MSNIFKYQGDEIAFLVRAYQDESKTTLINLDNAGNIIVYVFTDGCKKAMFSKTEKAGYIKLSRINETEYFGVIDSSITKLMAPGALIMEINIENIIGIDHGNNPFNIIKKTVFGSLKKSLIKIESL
ncbi:MAG: hypothetical protein LBQ74_13045 [Prevotella sp.]|jgi:hypothetical protein|nr:hypothetical protein [Prevotella sp.]